MTDRRASTLTELDKAIEKSGVKLSHNYLDVVRRPVVRPNRGGATLHDITREQVAEAVAEYLKNGGKITKITSSSSTSSNKANLNTLGQDGLAPEYKGFSSSDYLEDI